MTNKQLANTLFKMLRGSGLDYYVNYSEQPIDGKTTGFTSVLIEDYYRNLPSVVDDAERQSVISEVQKMIDDRKEMMA